MTRYSEANGKAKSWPIIRDSILFFFFLVAAMMAGCPVYNVWEQGLAGKAALARAEQDRQIRIKEAMALEESSKFQARAEISRAGGVSEANDIIAGGLGGSEGYLRYLYIQALSEHAGKLGQVIYVPTEAGLPILEAGKRHQ